jgi:four helix bundle suffix protein
MATDFTKPEPGQHQRLRPSGGYRKLRSYQVATIIYDATVSFCNRFVDKRSRTHDQMVQAARSGNKNIAEGSRAAATSSQTELRLVNVARASLEELLLDYEDYLRHRNLQQWAPDAPQALAVRDMSKQHIHHEDWADPQIHWKVYSQWLEHPEPAIVANALICLINQANYLLDKQISALERDFVQQGGYSEQLSSARLAERKKQCLTNQSDQADPSIKAVMMCPSCKKPMILRTARKGPNSGSQFWGCTGYPECKATVNVKNPKTEEQLLTNSPPKTSEN